ncbi:MAG TPA: hemerythrin domain-containing protein [Spirochaetes bacterium]|nr:hemerythrin domain-containing protein [Spirochaetota bacterium]
MSKLVEELKQEHVVLVKVLGEIQELGSRSQETKDKLSAVKAGLLNHLLKEDHQLYPSLRKAAESDPRLKTTLDVFAKEMDQISAFALDFFEKYSSESGGIQFAKDFGSLVASLSSRIRKEEQILYPEYDKLNP